MDIHLPLVGTYQPYNAALAITALECLRERGWKISDKNIIDGLNSVYWPGRFEILRREPVFVLDGAHNGHGIKATSASLKEHFKGQKLVFLLGVMADKDIDVMISCLAPMAKCFIAVRPDNHRAMDAEKLASLLSKTGLPVTSCSSIDQGVKLAIDTAGKDGVAVALGSLYFSGDIRKAVEKIKD
jgi:dihydrofolate synthase/folylpolyglutamate synthase